MQISTWYVLSAGSIHQRIFKMHKVLFRTCASKSNIAIGETVS